jgi:hypothetical protein
MGERNHGFAFRTACRVMIPIYDEGMLPSTISHYTSEAAPASAEMRVTISFMVWWTNSSQALLVHKASCRRTRIPR